MGIKRTLVGVSLTNLSLPSYNVPNPLAIFGSALKMWFNLDTNVTVVSSRVTSITDLTSGIVMNAGSNSYQKGLFVANAKNGKAGVAIDNATSGNIGMGFSTAANVPALSFEYNSPFSVGLTFVAAATGTLGSSFMLGSLSGGFRGWGIDSAYHNNLAYGLCLRLINSINSTELRAYGPGLAAGTTYNFVITYDGSGTTAGVKFYNNGVLVSTASDMNNIGTNTILGGGRFGTDGCDVGYMGYHTQLETLVVNRVITPTEVAKLDTYSNVRYAIH